MDNVIIYDKLEELNEGIEYNGGGIETLLGKGVVKSGQRGYGQYSFTGNGVSNILISEVDPGKALLFHDGMILANGKELTDGMIRIGDDGTSIELISGNVTFSPTVRLSWQVIEFY